MLFECTQDTATAVEKQRVHAPRCVYDNGTLFAQTVLLFDEMGTTSKTETEIESIADRIDLKN